MEYNRTRLNISDFHDRFSTIHPIDTTGDLILGVVVLVVSLIITFICFVTLAAKCSRGPRRTEYEAPVKMKQVKPVDKPLLQPP